MFAAREVQVVYVVGMVAIAALLIWGLVQMRRRMQELNRKESE